MYRIFGRKCIAAYSENIIGLATFCKKLCIITTIRGISYDPEFNLKHSSGGGPDEK